MSKTLLIKGALLPRLAGAALMGGRAAGIWMMVGVLGFGAFNILFSAPGTEWVRAVAIAGVFGALLWPAGLLALVVLLAWIVWPPAFMVSWALSRESTDAR